MSIQNDNFKISARSELAHLLQNPCTYCVAYCVKMEVDTAAMS